MESRSWYLVGHRGVGKTSLAKRLLEYFPDVLVVDLDAEIEQSENQSVTEIFSQYGEDYFRNLEIKNLKRLQAVAKANQQWTVFVLGAGFRIAELQSQDQVLWLRRASDLNPRIFLDRPRLNPAVAPQTEFKLRFDDRQTQFKKVTKRIYEMPEGSPNSHIEKKLLAAFLFQKLLKVDSILTITSELDLSNLSLVPNAWELRDDLLSSAEINVTQKKIVPVQSLLSIRSDENGCQELELAKFDAVDWDAKIWRKSANQKKRCAQIFSSHADSIELAFEELDMAPTGAHLKLCPSVQSWADLRRGWRWQQTDPKHRSFLPRSADGRWQWFRLWMQGFQKMGFSSLGASDVADQPSLYWSLAQSQTARRSFGAVLGSPIMHSQSPTTHWPKEISSDTEPFYAIEVRLEEWDLAISFLTELGMRRAAVTSPLKIKAHHWCERMGAKFLNATYGGVNTISWSSVNSQNVVLAANTDYPALAKWFSELSLSDTETTVWGGGGLLAGIRQLLPSAQFVGHRTNSKTKAKNLVWAAGQSAGSLDFARGQVERVIDLSYSESSRGREVAMQTGATYVSGQRFFDLQAAEQKKIWWPSGFDCERPEA